MDVAALHADIPDAPRLAAEDRLEELLEAFPLARSVVPKKARQVPVALEAVVEAVDDRADPTTASDRVEELRAPGHRRHPLGFAPTNVVLIWADVP
jgi:hypothetical protein